MTGLFRRTIQKTVTAKKFILFVIIFVIVDECGWLWVVVDGGGWLRMMVSSCGWLWVVVGGCGWLWVVAYFSTTR